MGQAAPVCCRTPARHRHSSRRTRSVLQGRRSRHRPGQDSKQARGQPQARRRPVLALTATGCTPARLALSTRPKPPLPSCHSEPSGRLSISSSSGSIRQSHGRASRSGAGSCCCQGWTGMPCTAWPYSTQQAPLDQTTGHRWPAQVQHGTAQCLVQPKTLRSGQTGLCVRTMTPPLPEPGLPVPALLPVAVPPLRWLATGAFGCRSGAGQEGPSLRAERLGGSTAAAAAGWQGSRARLARDQAGKEQWQQLRLAA